MANYERGSDDVRVFDAAEDEEDVEGSRLPLLIVIALLVLAAFAAVVWLAYQRGLQQGHSEMPHDILADSGPAKVAPANPGGAQTPYTGLKIYQQPAGTDEEGSADAAPPDAAPKPAATAPKPAVPPPTAPSTQPAPKPAVVASNPAPKPAAPPVATGNPIQLTPKPAATAPKPVIATPKPAPAAVEPKPAPPKPETATAPPAAAPAGAGLLQIGAFKSTAEAETAWRTYKSKHSALVSSLNHDVMQVDLGAKGTWYRLRIVAGSKSEASELCTKLKSDGGDCILVR